MSLVVAHLTDPHLGSAHGEPAASLRRALERVAAMDPGVDVVLLTGDLANTGAGEEYAQLREVLDGWTGPAPLLVVPGNHDERAALGASLGLAGDRLDSAHRVGGVLFCLLDSLVQQPDGTRATHGEIAGQSLLWLDSVLSSREPGERAIIVVHHPPIAIGQTVMDAIRLANAADLAEVLARHDGVVAVLAGHAHAMLAGDFGGIPVRVGGSLCGTMVLDAEGGHMVHDLPPTYALHLLGDDGSITTHWRAIPPT